MPEPTGQIHHTSLTFDCKPRLKKLTCGLINPERKLRLQLLERGCVVTGTSLVNRNKMTIHFSKKL